MFLRLNYYTSTNLHLSLESFYNNGLTSEEAKATIENIKNREFYCSPSGLNRNWIVQTRRDPDDEMRLIKSALIDALYTKKGIPIPYEEY